MSVYVHWGHESTPSASKYHPRSLIVLPLLLSNTRCHANGEVPGKSHDHLREEAQELMRFIQDKNVDLEDGGSKLSIVVELVAGKITDTIERMIALYRPDSLVVGTRGKQNLFESVGAALGAGVGSVSRCVLIRIDLAMGRVLYVRKTDRIGRRADIACPTHLYQSSLSSLTDGAQRRREGLTPSAAVGMIRFHRRLGAL